MQAVNLGSKIYPCVSSSNTRTRRESPAIAGTGRRVKLESTRSYLLEGANGLVIFWIVISGLTGLVGLSCVLKSIYE
jgi:hypothetical protein